MQTTFKALLSAALVASLFGVAVAKLPPPPPLTDQQKAEKAAKDKAATDAAKAELTKAEDRAVANYQANMKAKGKDVHTQMPASNASSDGGGKGLPAQPEKAANAHSPPKK